MKSLAVVLLNYNGIELLKKFLPKVLEYSLKGIIVVNDEEYDGVMNNQGLDNEEIADVMNYILNQWGNKSDSFVTSEAVDQIQKSILE